MKFKKGDIIQNKLSDEMYYINGFDGLLYEMRKVKKGCNFVGIDILGMMCSSVDKQFCLKGKQPKVKYKLGQKLYYKSHQTFVSIERISIKEDNNCIYYIYGMWRKELDIIRYFREVTLKEEDKYFIC